MEKKWRPNSELVLFLFFISLSPTSTLLSLSYCHHGSRALTLIININNNTFINKPAIDAVRMCTGECVGAAFRYASLQRNKNHGAHMKIPMDKNTRFGEE